MLAGIGPVKPFLLKPLIAHSESCGRAEDEPPTRSRCARAATNTPASAASPAARRGRTWQRARSARRSSAARCRRSGSRRGTCGTACPFSRRESAGRPHGRRRGVQEDQPGERRDAREDRAGEAVLVQDPDRAQPRMRPRRRWTAHALAQRRMRRVGGEPGRAKGTHRAVSAVSAEIVGGTLPEKRFSLRALRHSVPVQHARVGRMTARAAARRTVRPAG
jgi:hypothetical protein